MTDTLTAGTKFHTFVRRDTTYTSFDGLKIGISVFVPKSVKANSLLPVLVRWHGGALINGGRVYEPWFPKWIIDLATLHSSILICPDYRLLPESPGLHILDDLSHFYAWLHTSLSSFLTSFPSNPTPNLSSILITGESAGGYMAIQSALLNHTKGVKAVLAHYPMLDLKAPFYSSAGYKEIFKTPPPVYPEAWLEKQLEAAKSAQVVTYRIPQEGDLDLFVALLQAGRYTEVLGTDSSLYPLENLKRVKEEGRESMPMWIFHGDEDTVIPIDGTVAFMQEVERVFGVEQRRVVSRIIKGKEHGFDDDTVGLNEEFVVEAQQWLKEHWP